MKQSKGFTLIELMIVVAIIGILASVALPAYQTYTKKSKFTEIVLAASSVKTKIDLCFQTRGDLNLANCDTYTKIGATAASTEVGTYVSDVAITATTAVITATGTSAVDGEDFVLVPSATNDTLVWSDTGSSCIAAGLC